ncbi:reprolysin-like metallopeptidase [Robertkochia solimangrovi]|uniref:reprolysin-like metallopeptidase n=1 Tax=Robertkochia solimangrovi TaxID=2213046 RepID=UPI0011800A33|nr:zinc-dependent metalloprotease family protein [Robertkochia solimangrovi]TRZ43964.1 convertase [Robertkochia solimangrovi]
MRDFKYYILFTLILTVFHSGFAQQVNPWEESVSTTLQKGLLSGADTKIFRLDKDQLKNALLPVTKGISGKSSVSQVTLTFPDIKGTADYRVSPYSTLSAGLQEKFPEVRSYKGINVSDPSKILYFTLDPYGFHGMIREGHDIHYINPTENTKDTYYIASRKDLLSTDDQCLVLDENAMKSTAEKELLYRGVNDGNLRTYRLAIACTGEYATFHINRAGVSNGTESQKITAVLAAMNTTMTRVNGVFENELAITMEIIANNEEIIFLDSATDGLTNSNGNTLLNEIQDIIDDAIGFTNYDIGHVFSTGGGGVAQVASVCTSNKARGVTGLNSPVNDDFDIDFVAHEMGHQFGATHIFNNSCDDNRSAATAVEPGSGSTIMGYAGLCPANVQGNSDAYFNAISIAQIWDNVTVGNSQCAQLTAIGNNAPVVTEGADHTIPAGTPFVLEGIASDADGDGLTYCWEQQNNEIGEQPPASTATGGPIFRSRAPVSSPKRYFPQASALLNNNLSPTWEVIPTVSRTMDFSLTVRDNNALGGQSTRDDIQIEVHDTGEPFSVSSHTSESVLAGGSTTQVTWNVANTNIAPINTDFVDIYLIVDGNFTNPVLISDNTENDGGQEVIIPGDISSDNVRIMVKADDNIYFALNTATLEVQQSNFALEIPTLEYDVCQPNDLIFTFTYHAYSGFNETTTFSATDVTSGLAVSFSQPTAVNDNTEVEVSVSGTGNTDTGLVSFDLIAESSGGQSNTYPISINLYNTTFEQLTLNTPSDGSSNVLLDNVFTWEEHTNAKSYEIQISQTPNFNTIIETAEVNSPEYVPQMLEGNTQYFWRVRPINDCGEGAFSNAFSFASIPINCNTFTNNNTVNIPSEGTQTITSVIALNEQATLNSLSVSVNITHTFVEDLIITLTSPSGKTATLISQQCGSGQNMNVTFSDDGDPLVCGNLPAVSGTVQPQQSFSIFRNEPVNGNWTLTVNDTFTQDGGTLNSFGLNLCVNGTFEEDSDGDGVFDSIDQCPDTPANSKVDVNGCPIFSVAETNYQLLLTGESCSDNNDGTISITTESSYNYTATLTGLSGNMAVDFTDSASFSNLSAGVYQLCFTVEGEDDYQQCFDINIEEPQSLQVYSVADQRTKTVTLELSGADLYNIELNGITTQTAASTITLDLQEGINNLKVTTNKSCQGIYEEKISLGNLLVAAPNPFTDKVTVYHTMTGEAVSIRIYSLSGRMVYRSEGITNKGQQLEISLGHLQQGMYLLNLTDGQEQKIFKLVKE